MTQDHDLLEISAGPRWGFAAPRVRRALLVLSGLLAAGWCLSGITEVPFGSRAVVEQFGVPVGVFRPGLHLAAPWPFGRTRRVEVGVVRPVDLPAWLGVRLLYRIGDTDAQVMDAVFASRDPSGLVQAAGSQALVRLGGPAVTTSQAVATATQAALDQLDCGLEIVGVVLPAAPGMQNDAAEAAAVAAQTLLTEARSAATTMRAAARQTAEAELANARANAAETVAAARSLLVSFTTDEASYKAAAKPFLMERYFADLSRAIGHAPKTIIDHRLNWPQAPELDLRPPPGLQAAGGKGN